MSRKIFVNVPVKDLKKSMAFFDALGFKNNPQFTDETAACMVVSEEIFVMILTHAKFKSFMPKGSEVSDARTTTEVMLCLSCDSKAEVDDITRKAVAAGGNTFREPMDYGFMYGQSFQDPDGHIWEVVWMDPAAVNQG